MKFVRLHIAVFFAFCLSSSPAAADRDEDDTGVEGTAGNDNIVVNDPTTATAILNALGIESLASIATVIDSLGGNDVVTTSGDEISPSISTAEAGGVFVDFVQIDLNTPSNPLQTEDNSVSTESTATGIASGSGDDIVNNNSVLLNNALSITGANEIEVSAVGSGELSGKTEASAAATATGIRSGAGGDQVLNELALENSANAIAEAVSLEIAAADSNDPSRNVKTNAQTGVTAMATATGIEAEDNATETDSDNTTPLSGGGFRFTSTETTATVSGDDTVTNSGILTSRATALGGNASASISAQASGTSAASADVSVSAAASGISAGGGNDFVASSGTISSVASATAGAVALNVGIANPPQSSNPGAPQTADDDDVGSSTTNVDATARAMGIDADGSGHAGTAASLTEIADGSLHLTRSRTISSVAGDDTVTNLGIVDASATATASSESVDVVVSTGGSAATESKVAATTESNGIYTGAGADTVTNSASLDASATSTARATSIEVGAGQSTGNSNPGSPAQTHTIATSSENRIESSATAAGIDAEGTATFESSGFELSIGAGGLSLSRDRATTAEAGNDTITNSGILTTNASSMSESVDLGLQLDASGSVKSDTSTSASSSSQGVYTGGGADIVDNTGLLAVSSDSTATSVAAQIAMSEAPDTDNNPAGARAAKSTLSADAGVTSSATATGIDAEGNQHNQTSGWGLDITRNSLNFSQQREHTTLSGDDVIINNGIAIVDATATTGSVTAGVEIEAAGSTDAKAESAASAAATGIASGGGADDITNDGALTSTSFANAGALSVGVAVQQPDTGGGAPPTAEELGDRFASTKAGANVTSTATSTGIDAEGVEQIYSQSSNLSISGDGLSVTYDRSTLSDSGDDVIRNTGAVITFAESASAAGAADINLAAGGTASAEANASSIANSAGILTGGGSDTISNSGALTSDAVSAAGTISVAFSQAGPGVPSQADARAEAEATSTAIATDNGAADDALSTSLTINQDGISFSRTHAVTAQQGADEVTNSGLLTTTALAGSAALGVDISIDSGSGQPSTTNTGTSMAMAKVDGSASTDVSSSAQAASLGLDTGGGSDTITNDGVINSTAGSAAVALAVGFGQSTSTSAEQPKVKVTATTDVSSSATGIAADSGADMLVDTTLAISADGVSATHRREIVAAGGDDDVTSNFAITTTAVATTNSDSVSVAIDAAAQADASASALSDATGVVTGGGNDVVRNAGLIAATSAANADVASVAVGQSNSDTSPSSTKVEAGTESVATATGVATDGGENDSLFDLSLTIDGSGISFAYENSTTAAVGDDTLINSGAIASNAWADAGALAAPVTIKGASQSSVSTSASAAAIGLDTGGGADWLENYLLIEAGSLATATTANASVTTAGTAIANSGLLEAGTFASADVVGVSTSGSALDQITMIWSDIGFEDFSISAGFSTSIDDVTGDGADTVFNEGGIVAISEAFTAQGAVAVDAGSQKPGLAISAANSEATATAAGLQTGNGDDYIDNSGLITSRAGADGYSGTVSVTMKGIAAAGNAVAGAATVARAESTGIDADNGEIETTFANFVAGPTQADASWGTTIMAASGDDTIINSGGIEATAESDTLDGTVAVSISGAAATNAASQAESSATAVNAGAGHDSVTNTGDISADASASSWSGRVGVVAQSGLAVSMSGDNSAAATAVGIDGDGTYLNFEDTTELTGTVGPGNGIIPDVASSLTLTTREQTAVGNDYIFNSGVIDVDSSANNVVGEGSVVVSQGVAATVTNAGATADAIGIRTGSGDDEIDNDGNVDTNADATAVSVGIAVTAVGVGAAANAIMEGGTQAAASSIGVEADGGFVDEHIVEIASSIEGSVGSFTTSVTETTTSGATSGADIVRNSGEVTSNATAVAPEISFALVAQGVAGAISTSTADADAAGIRMGGGVDNVTNDGNVASGASAIAVAANVTVDSAGVGLSANSVFDGGVNADASSVGINTDGGGAVETTTDATLVSLDQTQIINSYTITTDDGDDVLENTAEVTADADAVAVAVTGAYSGAGVAAGVGTSAASASATSVDTGGGADDIDNDGRLVASAVANADTVNGTFSNAGFALSADAAWSGGTTTTASAAGINSDGGYAAYSEYSEYSFTGVTPLIVDETHIVYAAGEDAIDNSGNIDATATAVSPSVGVAVTPAGGALAVTTATSNADATAIIAGAGSDDILNSGMLDVLAVSNADAVSVAVVPAGVAMTTDAVWDGGTTANATAIGIEADGGHESYTERDEYTVTGLVPSIVYDLNEVHAAGDDKVENTGDMDINATAVSPSIGVAVTPAGASLAITTATSNTDARAISTGGGDDDIVNSGMLDVLAVSNSDAIGVAVTPAGVAIAADAVWSGGTTTNATAVGIHSDGGRESYSERLELTSDPDSPLVNYEVTETFAAGNDTIENSGDIEASATAVSPSIAVSVTPAGAAASLATATSNADAAAIATGAGDDDITNSGLLAASAVSNADSVNFAVVVTGGVSLAANNVWDGGVTANATATGIRATGPLSHAHSLAISTPTGANFDFIDTSDEFEFGTGDKNITNENDITVDATSVSAAATVSVAVAGVAGAISTATADAGAAGIQTGSGMDAIDNSHAIKTDSDAVAVAVNGSGTGAGVALSGDAVWDTGTLARAESISIDTGDGIDDIDNDGDLTTTSTSTTVAAELAIVVFGVGATAATSTVDSSSTGVDAGAGDDDIENNGTIVTEATSTAVTAQAGGTFGGVTVTTDSVWDGGTSSDAHSNSIVAGDGNDVILNAESVTTNAASRANSINVPITVFGVSAATTTSNAVATGASVDGGAGDDIITNQGDILSDIRAHATSVGVSITGIGAAGAIDAEWDGGTGANATAAGIVGGDGDDRITNEARVETRAESDADSVQVSVSGLIGALATASSTADAVAMGIDAVAGGNLIMNSNEVIAHADAEATATAVAGTLAGFTGADPFMENQTTADSIAMGIRGLDGVDAITALDTSSIDVDAIANARDSSVTVTVAGFNNSNANSTATSFASGVDAGDGNNVLNLAGSIDVSADSRAKGAAFDISAGGAVFPDAAATAAATAAGIRAGSNDDIVANSATITVGSVAENLGRATGITVGGAAFSGIDKAESTATATGIDLGDGINVLTNTGGVTVSSTSDNDVRSIGAGLYGFSASKAKTDTFGYADGVVGGIGVDAITNSALVSASSSAMSNAQNINLNLAGAAIGESVLETTSAATGIRTDLGDDVVINLLGGTVASSASATTDSSGNFSMSLAGFTGHDLTLSPASSAVGIDTSDGADAISTSGIIDVSAISLGASSGTSFNLFGASAADSGADTGTAVTAAATGVQSGEGDDVIVNAGTIEVGVTDDENSNGAWMALLDMDSSTTNFAGSANSSASARAMATSLGMDGGNGADELFNVGTIDVYANALNDTFSNTTGIFGVAGSAANTGAQATAVGLSGAAGADSLANLGALLVSTRSRLVLNGASYQFGGASSASAELSANTNVSGILGGDGADAIDNMGTLLVRGRAELSSTGNSDTTFGAAVADATTGAVAVALGIGGEGDDDTITNAGPGASIDVEASVDLSTNSGSYTFLGASGTDIALTGRASAVGIAGGDGDDVISGDGDLAVLARASLVAKGGAKTSASIAGGGESIGEATTDTAAVGIAGGDGDDELATGGSVSVASESIAASQNTTSNSAAIVSNTRAESRARSTSAATGFGALNGSDAITNSGSMLVRAFGSSHSASYANGARASITGTARAVVNSEATAVATGVAGGDGDQAFVNDGNLTVLAEAGTSQPIETTVTVLSIVQNANPDSVDPTEAPTFEGDTLPPAGDGTDYPEADVLFWSDTNDTDGDVPVDDPQVGPPGGYYQVERIETTASDGTITVSWEWQYRPVTAYERTYASSGSRATEAGARGHGANGNGDAIATGTTNANAIGVHLGAGNDDVTNAGNISVTAQSVADVVARAAGSSSGNASASASATANASATGVHLGNGDNTLVNNGSIEAIVIAAAMADARADAGNGFCITILFWEFCIAPGTASPPVENETRTVDVAGVVAGDGNDTIVNNGTISATVQDMQGNVLTHGIGIHTGAGNDSLTLGDGSLVVGTVDLGTGDDTLVLEGMARVESHLGDLLPVNAGDGQDLLVLSGAGAYSGVLDSFENALKTGLGTFWLEDLQPVDTLAIEGGILELGSDYTFGSASSYSTFVHSDLLYGGLHVNGVATLDGALTVARGGDNYIEDDTSYAILSASDSVVGAFATVSLPESLPLLDFALEQSDNAVEVVARAASFSSVTGIPLHAQIAANLDVIAPGSTGDLREQFGTIQLMSSGFDDGFASLAPDMHLTGTTNTIAVSQQTTQLLRRHLGNARAVAGGQLGDYAAYNPVLAQYDGLMASLSDASIQPAATGGGSGPSTVSARTWLLGFAGRSDVDLISGYTDYKQKMAGFAVGADWTTGDSFLIGASVSYADAEIVMNKAAARTDTEGWSGSMYATGFSDTAWVEGGIYFGTQKFSGERTLLIDSATRSAASQHDGSTSMLFLGAGRPVVRTSWSVEPYASLYWLHISEDGFEESGAGDLNQVVARKSAEALLGEVGATFNWRRPSDSGLLDWQLSLGYHHDFEVDDLAVSYAFAGSPNDFFSIEDRNLAGGSAVLGAGLAYIRERSVLSLDYRGQRNGDYSHQVIGARFSWAFR